MRAGTASSKKTWVAKVQNVPVPTKPSKGQRPGVTDGPTGGNRSRTAYEKSSISNGKSSNRIRGTRQAATKKLAPEKLSVDEVQHGLTMILHQFKSAYQEENYTIQMQHQWPQEELLWSDNSLQQEVPWGGVQHPWGEIVHPWTDVQHPWGQTQESQHDCGLPLGQFQFGSSDMPLSVIESDEGTSLSDKTYGRGFLIRSRRFLLLKPGIIGYDGPKWSVGARPLELNVQINADEVAISGMPRSPPPKAPPSFRLDLALESPSLDTAPSWDPSLGDTSMTFDSRYLTLDMSMDGYMTGFVAPETIGWEGNSESYFLPCDGNEIPSLLPEVPSWPFAFGEQSMSSNSSSAFAASTFMSLGSKFDGQEMEDIESTAASSGQPASVSQSPLHAPVTFDPVTEAKARLQVEYYLSVENLCHDPYLCSKLDKDGWVQLDVLAAFPRMRRIGIDAVGIAAALASSTQLEVSHDSPPRVRRSDVNTQLTQASPTVE